MGVDWGADIKSERKKWSGKRKKKPRTQHGYKFESEIGASLEALQDYGIELYYRKLVDTSLFDIHLFCNHCHQKVKHNLVIPKSICDYIIVTDSGAHFIECKSSKNQTSFPYANIKPHQLEYGLKINSYDHTTYSYLINDRRHRGHYRCHLLSADDLDDLMGHTDPRVSAKWEEVEHYSLNIPRLEFSQWDLIPMIKRFGVDVDI